MTLTFMSHALQNTGRRLMRSLQSHCISWSFAGDTQKKACAQRLEIIALAKLKEDMFGEPTGFCETSDAISTLVATSEWIADSEARCTHLELEEFGQRYSFIVQKHIPFDLYLAKDGQQYGVMEAFLALWGNTKFRTDLQEVCEKHNLKIENWRMIKDNEAIFTPTESIVLQIIEQLKQTPQGHKPAG